MIGCALHDLRLPTRRAILTAYEMGFGVVEIGAGGGETAPRALSESGRRELARLVRDRGMNPAALDTHFRGGLTDPASVDERVAHTKAVVTMARDMGIAIVTSGVGRLGDERSLELAASALSAIGEVCEGAGVLFAVQTDGVDSAVLGEIVQGLSCPSMRYCVDPGVMLMAGADPVEVVGALSDNVLLAHARDAMTTSSGGSREAVLGEGEVDYLAFLAALSAAGYHGPHIVRRTDSSDPAPDIARAKAFLESQPSL